MAVIRRPRDGALLVSEAPDGSFQRPLGGHVEFGEYAVDTLHREFGEEIGQRLTGVRLLGVLENIFPWQGGTEHEVVFIYRAALADETSEGGSAADTPEGRGLGGAGGGAPPPFPRAARPELIGGE